MEALTLSGIKIVNFGLNLPGPMLAARLMKKGASVQHVEPPAGDPTRMMFRSADGTPLLYALLHDGSETIAVDLRNEVQRRVALAKCEEADVIIDSFLPGTLRKLGIDEEDLRGRNPGLVYCSIVGFDGGAGSAEVPGHDINFLAASGVADALGLSPGHPLPRFPIGDIAGGVLAAETEVLAALYARSGTGLGRKIAISIVDVLEDLNVMAKAGSQTPADRFGAFLSGCFPCYRLYECAGNSTVALGALEPKFWERFCLLIGYPELKQHQFVALDSDVQCHQTIESVLRGKSASVWEAASLAAPCCLNEVKKVLY
ncbi:coA-transferase III family protein [Paraburkholderia fungorum]|uniref:CoA-transferase III family protein n=1 Tax=Paraburkholderia fungorum TaxID=134537 RepID=A0AAU8T9F7_9BURK|nr:coA-transferase III family protein [Paraburkholderia fungorum]